MSDFHRVRRLPPYVFEQVNRLKAQARANAADIIDLGMGNPDLPAPRHVIAKLVENPLGVSLPAKDKAMLEYSIALTRHPQSITEENINELRRQGLVDEEILHLALVSAYFNFVNRLASGLGVELEEEGQTQYRY